MGRPGIEPGEAVPPDLQSGPLPSTEYRPIYQTLFCGTRPVENRAYGNRTHPPDSPSETISLDNPFIYRLYGAKKEI